jgi:hypothetical protein
MDNYIIHNKLVDIIPYIPIVKQGKYNGYSIVLIGGSSYKSTAFNKFEIDKKDDFYRKFNYEVEFPNINFQKRLSKHTQTFSFDRPTDLLNHNIYSNENYKHLYIASKKDLTIKNYAVFIHELLKYNKIKPPYVFVVFSEGGYDVMCYSKYYEHLIKNIYFIDNPFLENHIFDFEKYRGNIKWYDNLFKNKLSWNRQKEIQKEDLIYIDVYNFEIKTINIILKLKIKDLSKTIKMYILWSPYFDKPTVKDKMKIKIQKEQNSKLPDNIVTMWYDAPHQMERIIPITLSNFILGSITN